MRPRGALTVAAAAAASAPLVFMMPKFATSSPVHLDSSSGAAGTCAWLPVGGTASIRHRSAARESAPGNLPPARPSWPSSSMGSPLSTSLRKRRASSRRRPRQEVLASLAYRVDGDKWLLFGEEARRALERGDVYEVLGLLEDQQESRGAGDEVNGDTAAAAAAATAAAAEAASCGDPSSTSHSQQQLDNDNDNSSGERNGQNSDSNDDNSSSSDLKKDSPRAAHARLIQLLWRGGHEKEALETFDLARFRAHEAATATTSPQARTSSSSSNSGRTRPHGKAGAGIPGLFLDLEPDTCHGIMRRKLAENDSQGVMEAMRCSTRLPSRGKGVVVVGSGTGSSKRRGGEDGRGEGWAPTEETYAIALEACGNVRKRWGFKAALFLIQEMRDARLDISLVHYRGAVLACSLTRQLAGVLPLLEDMRARGVVADAATYNAAISSCTVAQVKRALNLVQMMRSEGIAPTEITYNILLRLCGVGGCWAMGLELMVMMEDEGVSPTLYHYNSVLKALERADRWREAASLFRKMRTQGLRPNALTYGPLIGVLEKSKKRKMAGAVLEEMLAASPRDSTRTYNQLLNACAKARQWEQAQKLFKDMMASDVEPDVVTYNTVINAMGRCGRIVEATEHLCAMKEQGLTPDVVTFGTLIHACAQSSRREAALALFSEMVSRGLKPNLEAYKGCIVSCQKAGSYDQALDLFDSMLADRVRPDRVVYNAAIACCAQLKLWRRGVALLDEMQVRGVNPDQYSYNSAIYACVKAKQSLQMTMVLARMREDGFSPDVWTYSNLIRCLADSLLWRRAVAILDDMLVDGGVEADAHCFNSAISACAKAGEWAEAERLVTEMRGHGLVPDKYTYSSVMNAYGVSGEWTKALSMLDEMRALGVKISSMTYSAAIKACDKGMQWERALELLERMDAVDGTKPNLFAYNYAMSACVRADQSQLALDLLERMKAGGLRMDRMTYGVVMFLHSRRGEWMECLRINQQMEEDGIPGDWYSYHAMLVALSKGDRWEQAVETFDDMKRSSSARPDCSCYGTMLRVCQRAGFAAQAVEYLKEMPTVGVRPSLGNFKQALGACETVAERDLSGGGGVTEASSFSGVEDGVAGGRRAWEEAMAGVLTAVPVIFRLMRENDLSPDGDCYSSAVRACQNAGMGDAASTLVDDLQAYSAVKRLETPPLAPPPPPPDP